MTTQASAIDRPTGLDETVRQIREHRLRHVTAAVAVIGFGIYIVSQLADGEPNQNISYLGMFLAIVAGMAALASKRSANTSSWILVCGLHAAVIGVLLGMGENRAIYALAVIPIIANGLLGLLVGIGAGLVGSVAIVAHALMGGQNLYGAIVSVPCVVMWATLSISWALHRGTNLLVAWSWSSYETALTRTEEAQQRKADLLQANKSLAETHDRLRHLTELLTRAELAAREAQTLKQQFVANVSHELRTPLNIIIGFSEMMTVQPESYGLHRMPTAFLADANRIYRSAEHLKGLIDDVLDLAQMEADRMSLSLEPCDLAKLARSTVDMVGQLAQQSGLHLLVAVPDGLPDISVDVLRIRQVLLNLLTNAIRYTEQGYIEVSAQRHGDEIVVSVRDTGIGIAREHLTNVFREFEQVDGSIRRRYGGAGLGLAVSKRFIELHGGRIWVESEFGKGSKFSFALPLSASERTQYPRLQMSRVSSAQDDIVITVGASSSADSLLRNHLDGYEIVRAPNDADLATMVHDIAPKAIVLDTFGIEQGNPDSVAWEGWGVPVIACPLPSTTQLAHALGVKQYLVKPVQREQLLSAVEDADPDAQSILIVEDDAHFAHLMERMLRTAAQKYNLDVAMSGQPALAAMERRRPDVILLDMVMPGMGGHELLAKIRDDTALSEVSVIIVSAKESIEDFSSLASLHSIELRKRDGFSTAEVVSHLQGLLDRLPTPLPKLPESRPEPPESQLGEQAFG